MLRFLADEDFNGKVLRGLLRREPSLDVVRVQDVGLSGLHDREVLAWAANEQRLLLTHDAATMTKYGYERMTQGLFTAGIVEVDQALPFGLVINDLLLLATGSLDNEWDNQVVFLPLR